MSKNAFPKNWQDFDMSKERKIVNKEKQENF